MAIKFKLLPDHAPPRIDVPGEYHRDFSLEVASGEGRVASQEFECTRDEWEKFLFWTGNFEIVDKQKSVGVGDGAKARDK